MASFVSIIRHALTDVIVRGERRGGVEVITQIVVGRGARMIVEANGVPPLSTRSDVARLLRDYLDGSIIDFSSIPIDPGEVTPFRSKVLLAARRIPYGEVYSYTKLAAMAGVPKAVRAVGSIMRGNPLPIIIPCHRVIRSDGSPGAYCGDRSGEDATLKKALLQMERSALKMRR